MAVRHLYRITVVKLKNKPPRYEAHCIGCHWLGPLRASTDKAVEDGQDHVGRYKQ